MSLQTRTTPLFYSVKSLQSSVFYVRQPALLTPQIRWVERAEPRIKPESLHHGPKQRFMFLSRRFIQVALVSRWCYTDATAAQISDFAGFGESLLFYTNQTVVQCSSFLLDQIPAVCSGPWSEGGFTAAVLLHSKLVTYSEWKKVPFLLRQCWVIPSAVTECKLWLLEDNEEQRGYRCVIFTEWKLNLKTVQQRSPGPLVDDPELTEECCGTCGGVKSIFLTFQE